jgi:hypothetical protein
MTTEIRHAMLATKLLAIVFIFVAAVSACIMTFAFRNVKLCQAKGPDGQDLSKKLKTIALLVAIVNSVALVVVVTFIFMRLLWSREPHIIAARSNWILTILAVLLALEVGLMWYVWSLAGKIKNRGKIMDVISVIAATAATLLLLVFVSLIATTGFYTAV